MSSIDAIDEITRKWDDYLSLEGAVLSQRAHELRIEATKLCRQRAFLREERRRARMEEELLRQEKRELDYVKREDWVPAAYLPGPNVRRVRLNIGGQVFEVSETVLRRDTSSLLAALFDDTCPLKMDQDGMVYVDRDWWTFRYLLKFLRDGVLPDNNILLAQAWWTTLPNWWEAKPPPPPAPKKTDPKKEEKPKLSDWWTGTEYKGRKYDPIPCEDEKAPKQSEGGNPHPSTLTTWSTSTPAMHWRSIW